MYMKAPDEVGNGDNDTTHLFQRVGEPSLRHSRVRVEATLVERNMAAPQ